MTPFRLFILIEALSIVLAGQTVDLKEVVRQSAEAAQAGHPAEAAAGLDAAIRHLERITPHHPELPKLLNALASVSIDSGALANAEHAYRRALSLEEVLNGENSEEYAGLLAGLAALYGQEGRLGPAISLARRASSISKTDHYALTLANLLITARLDREAETLLSGIHSTRLMPAVLNDLGVIRMRRGDLTGAIALFVQCADDLTHVFDQNNVLLVRPLLNLASAQIAMKNLAEADSNFRRALAIAEQSLPTGFPSFEDVVVGYSAFLRKRGKRKEAVNLETKVRSLHEEIRRSNGIGQTVSATEIRR